MDGAPPPASPAGLSAYVAVSQLLGLTLLAATGAWLGRYRGGVAWQGQLQFNVHPLCMVLGMVFLQGDALLVYRVFRNEAKRSTKTLHALLHGLALVIALVGIVAVFESHRAKGITDMYSLHSWCGMAAFVLYLVQWLLGCGFFLAPGASFSLRSRYKPQHIFVGIALFALSIATCLLGITEMLLFNIRWVNDLGGRINTSPQSPQKCCSSPSPAGQSLAPARAEVLWLCSPPEGFGSAAAESLPDDASRGPHPAQLLLCSWWGTQQVLPPRCCQPFAEPPEKLGWRTRGCPLSPESPLPIGLQAGGPPCPSTSGDTATGYPQEPPPCGRGSSAGGGALGCPWLGL
uniref:Transmembrane ascorbate-dependent reductase CYB561 n=1 Tax=Anas platyrhynchos TaxID=8839 RepID=A0A8B9TF15_ANAPL